MMDRQAERFENLSPNKPVQILTGDFNAEPNSSTLRFLKGFEGFGTHGTLWCDAWEISGSGYGATSDPGGLPLAAVSAKKVGIEDLSELPRRRIDFILSRGWVYGKPGFPETCELISGVGASDHHGIVSTIRL